MIMPGIVTSDMSAKDIFVQVMVVFLPLNVSVSLSDLVFLPNRSKFSGKTKSAELFLPVKHPVC